MILNKTAAKPLPDNLSYNMSHNSLPYLYHINGQKNVVPDRLSITEDIDSPFADFDLIADAQINDNELQQLKLHSKSFHFKEHQLPCGKLLYCDTSTSNIRPFIPKNFRMRIFNTIHGLAHLEIRTTVKEITKRFIWPDMKKDVKQWA